MDKTAYGVVTPETLVAESGLAFLHGMVAGRHPMPPFCDTMNMTGMEAEEGVVTFIGSPTERYFNPLGTIHGGWTAGILDSAMACAVHSTLKPQFGYTTVEMKINYVRPVMPSSGPCRCEGRVIHRGAQIATSEGRLLDAKGRLLAHGSETCLIFPFRAAS